MLRSYEGKDGSSSAEHDEPLTSANAIDQLGKPRLGLRDAQLLWI